MKKTTIFIIGVVVIATPAAIAMLGLGDRIDMPKFSVSSEAEEYEGTGSLSKVHGSIKVRDGDSAEVLETVNGSITLGEGASARSIQVVNGSVSLGRGSRVTGSVESVNGSIEAEGEFQADGNVKTVNGKILLGEGSVVKAGVENVNGRMMLTGTTAGSVATTNGDITLEDGTVILGDLSVKKSTGLNISFGGTDHPRVVIGENCEVRGRLHFEKTVELEVADSATIGEITGEAPIRN